MLGHLFLSCGLPLSPPPSAAPSQREGASPRAGSRRARRVLEPWGAQPGSRQDAAPQAGSGEPQEC